MKLTIKEIKKITWGAVNITEDEVGVTFHRFTEKEEELYKNLDVKANRTDFPRAMSPAGIKLCFKTDSKTLRLSADLSLSGRHFYSFDIFANGKLLKSITSFKEEELPFKYSVLGYEPCHFDSEVTLPDGENDIVIYLPWSVRMHNFTLSIDDGATFIPTQKPAKKIMCYGDSITQGYDALYPHRRYAGKLAEMLDAEEINKAIGGEVFNPELAACKADFTPDYITVAYGTNDWVKSKKDTFTKNAKDFYRILSENYPNSKIFAITPIWRADCNQIKDVGEFSFVGEYIASVTEKLPNVTVIRGDRLVPHYTDFFADLYLHPRDAGFDFYAINLYKEIEKYL